MIIQKLRDTINEKINQKAKIYLIIRKLYIIYLFGGGGGVSYLQNYRQMMPGNSGGKESKIIKLKYDKKGLYLRTFTTDISLANSVLIGDFGNRMWNGEYVQVEKYLCSLKKENPVIIDAGANIGLFSRLILKCKPNARIYAIEPEMDNYNLLVKNTKEYSNVTCMKKGLWSKECFLKVIARGTGAWGFMVKEAERESPETISAISIENILNKYNIDKIDLLKMDVEGSEYEIFTANNLSWLDRCDAVVIETHDDIVKDADKTVNDVLANYGFKKHVHGENQFFIREKEIITGNDKGVKM